MSQPNVTLTALSRVASQPLAYLYLSQIPYTGLDLGPIGTVLYWFALIVWALALAYLVLFGVAPFVNRRLREFGARVSDALSVREPLLAVATHPGASVIHEPHIDIMEEEIAPEASRDYSSYEGFKSFAHNGALSIDDIVKGLSKAKRAVPPVPSAPASSAPAPRVEPIYERAEPSTSELSTPAATHGFAPHTASVRGFAAALVEGDRVAVFAGLRQHIRGGGSPERLISDVVCLIDDAYRARVDGTACDAEIVRLTARLDTPTLEKLVTSLTTAIDSSYSTGVTGAKLALTRALTVLGA